MSGGRGIAVAGCPLQPDSIRQPDDLCGDGSELHAGFDPIASRCRPFHNHEVQFMNEQTLEQAEDFGSVTLSFSDDVLEEAGGVSRVSLKPMPTYSDAFGFNRVC